MKIIHAQGIGMDVLAGLVPSKVACTSDRLYGDGYR